MTDPRTRLVRLHQQLSQVLIDKRGVTQSLLVALLSRGHVLLEDVPGVGKTVVAKGLAKSIKGVFRRVQATPDLLPGDITGVTIYNQKTQEFDFVPGPVFANVLLVDEINRAPARTQSALLEAMAEQQVSVDGRTRGLAQPYIVLATQNPIEFHGTYPLPEAQMDRFMMRLSVGYPSPEAELAMLEAQSTGTHPVETVEAVLTPEDLVALQEAVTAVEVHADVARYIVRLVQATRHHAGVVMGASPRGSLALRRAAQALAFLAKQSFVTPQLVRQVAVPVLAHRLVLRNGGNALQATEAFVRKLLDEVPVPVGVETMAGAAPA